MNNPGSLQTDQNNEIQNLLLSSPKTDEKRAEFISTAQLYEAVYKNSFHPVFIADEEGQIVKYNEKFSLLFGFPMKDADQFHDSDFFQIQDDSFVSFINERNENGFAKAELTGLKRSGEKFPCRISSVHYTSDDGELRSINTIVNISTNISARWDFLG